MTHLDRPDWIQTWSRRPRETPADMVTLHAIVGSIRDGATLEETQDLTGLERPDIFSLVTAIGSRCTQIAKNHTRAARVLRGAPGAPPSSATTSEGLVITAAGGWVRARREGDIRKAYAGVLLAEDHVVTLAIQRVASAASDEVPVNYQHFSDLHGAARGVLPPLHKVVVEGTASDAYLRAWDLLDASIATAVAGVHQLLRDPTPQAVMAATRASFWLVPQSSVLHQWARVCVSPGTTAARDHAERRLRTQLLSLRHFAQRQPHRVLPTRLEQISIAQMRAIAALHGHHPSDGLNARTETAYEDFAAMAKQALLQAANQELVRGGLR